MKWLNRFCWGTALLPFIAAAVGVVLLKVLGCDENFGPAVTKCAYSSASVGDAAKGLVWLGAFGWLLSIPAAVIILIVSKLYVRLGKYSKDRSKDA